ncbi:type I-E CRISPR-associated protein Cse2/CasB [Streptomyces sp. NPDC093589]|uniref:type I-E CRISPR-associated protein Cse2/CasB n=1 Tax=Streptomyces sp. NPDC093589 TaxID=3366043 RepID=UPI0038307442
MTTNHMFTSSSQSHAWRKRGPVGAAADRHIRKLQHGYRMDSPVAVGALARLRRGVGRPALELADLWGLTGSEELLNPPDEVPDEQRQSIDHDRAELALHVAVTLWALHQQSHREADMHVADHGLGRAVRELMRRKAAAPGDSASTGEAISSSGNDEIDEPLRKRFVRVSTAHSVDSLAARLREVVLLLRAGGVPLDYGLLADQLYAWQRPSDRAQVHRAWGRDFHLAASGAKRREPAPDDQGGVPGQRETSDPYQPYGPLTPGD